MRAVALPPPRTGSCSFAYRSAMAIAILDDLYRLRDCQKSIADSRSGGACPVASAYCE